MKLRFWLGFWVLLLLSSASVVVSGEDNVPTAGEIEFSVRVWPLLESRCLSCHGAEGQEPKGGFDLRTRAALLRGGESGEPAVSLQIPLTSPLLQAVMRTSSEWSAMPPKETDRLSDSEIESLKTWIAAGAPWVDEQRVGIIREKFSKPTGIRIQVRGQSAAWSDREYDPANLWAYQPVVRPDVPDGAHPVDWLLKPRLDAIGVPPAPLADRRTLIRRTTLDLTGLPPSPEQVLAFCLDSRRDRDVFAGLIDKLLDSPHYGEQMARHWLDVVRYADTSGFANDFARGNAWRYRDYVIRSFQNDKPYDQFIREQIAGDEIDSHNPENLIAVGMLRMGPWELTGMEVAKVARQRFLDDVTNSVGETFLAHSLQCARCHDHKFDPVPTRDYYSLQSVFATTQLTEREAPFLPQENTCGFEERKYLEQRRAHYDAILARLEAQEAAAAKKWAGERGLKYIPRAEGLKKGVPEDQLAPKHVGFTPADFGNERVARKGRERLKWEFDRYEPVAFSVYSGPTPNLTAVYNPLRMPKDPATTGQFEETAILAGGDPFSPTEKVTPAGLSAAGGYEFPPQPRGRRAALAEWIASPKNPLTARVIVNRIWQWHFGEALAGNPNNFGATGKKPTHPELLDWLASELVAKNWSIKAIHRIIMTSEAYQRSSRHPDPKALALADPLGTSYAEFKVRRLAAEEIHDSILTITGELNRSIGGIPVRPEIHPEVAFQPRMVMGTFAEAWQPSVLPQQRHRRSIYALKIRGQRDSTLEVFNAPSPDLSCERRDVSSVTPQVFALFNSQASSLRAIALAKRLTSRRSSLAPLTAKDQASILHEAFQLVFQRDPGPDELQACLTHWDAMRERHQTLDIPKPVVPREITREAVEENTGERFSFVEPLESAGDFVPDPDFADVDIATRGLAEVCLVLLNSNEFMEIE